MEEKDMTFEEFEQQVRVELARRMHAEPNSEVVDERLNEEDSKDLIVYSWENYNQKKCLVGLASVFK